MSSKQFLVLLFGVMLLIIATSCWADHSQHLHIGVATAFPTPQEVPQPIFESSQPRLPLIPDFVDDEDISFYMSPGKGNNDNPQGYYEETGTPPGYEEPGNPPGYEEPGNPPGYEEPGNPPGFEEPGNPPGHEESPIFTPPDV